MRLIVLSDIHGNLEAFNEVLAWADQAFTGQALSYQFPSGQLCSDQVLPGKASYEQPLYDRIVTLGDNIGYGPDPNAVMEKICERNILSVLGNHEMALINPAFLASFNPVAREAGLHTRNHVLPAFKRIIEGWSKSMVLGDIRFVHGTPPESPFLYLFQLSDVIVQRKMEAMDQWVCFVGHTHSLGLIVLEKGIVIHQSLNQGKIILDQHKKYIVNAGSVGQSRDGNPCAKALFFDTKTGELEVVFIPYDYHTTAMKIRKSSIPDVYADKLSKRF